MTTLFWFALAALAEIAGCYLIWLWMRQGGDVLLLPAGAAILFGFALALARIDQPFAGRSFAAYGGFYIVASLLWLWTVEGVRPDRWDAIGAVLCLAGAATIIAAPRAPA